MDVGEGSVVVAMTLPASGRAVAATARTAAFAFQGAEQTTCGKAHSRRHDCQCYDCLYHNQINRLPIWKKAVDTIQASPMV